MAKLSNINQSKLPIGTIRKKSPGPEGLGNISASITDKEGTWLESNKIYSKSQYPEFSNYLGDIGATPFTSQTAPTTDTYHNIIVDGQKVMVMASGDRIVSTDGGTTFANGDHGSTGEFHVIGWDGFNGIVAVGPNKNAKYSTDKGKTWTHCDFSGTLLESKSSSADDFTGIAYGNGVWVATYYDSNGVMYSTDGGATWTDVTVPNPYSFIHGVGFGNGVFIISRRGDDRLSQNRCCIMRSTDGINWEEKYTGSGSDADRITGQSYGINNGVKYGGGVWVVLHKGIVFRSTDDGVTWTKSSQKYGQISGSSLSGWFGVEYFYHPNTGHMWGGYDYGNIIPPGGIHKSFAYMNPTQDTSGIPSKVTLVGYWNSHYYLWEGSNTYVSADPTAAAPTFTNTGKVTIYDTDNVGGNRQARFYIDPIQNMPLVVSPEGMSWSNDHWATKTEIAMGANGLPASMRLGGIAFNAAAAAGQPKYMLPLEGGYIAHSIDGTTWTSIDLTPLLVGSSTTSWYAAAWNAGAGLWMVVGTNQWVAWSSDGTNWTTKEMPPAKDGSDFGANYIDQKYIPYNQDIIHVQNQTERDALMLDANGNKKKLAQSSALVWAPNMDANKVYYPQDGGNNNWDTMNIYRRNFVDIASDGNKFVFVSTHNSQFWETTDCTSFTSKNQRLNSDYPRIKWEPDLAKWVYWDARGNYDRYDKVPMLSADLEEWELLSSPNTLRGSMGGDRTFTYENGKFILTSNNAAVFGISWSDDGLTWKVGYGQGKWNARYYPKYIWWDSTQNLYVGLPNEGWIMTSPDLKSWSYQKSDEFGQIFEYAWSNDYTMYNCLPLDNGEVCLVGNYSYATVVKSNDWTKMGRLDYHVGATTNISADGYNRIRKINNKYYACSSSSVPLLVSDDLINWKKRFIPISMSILDITANADYSTWVLACSTGTLMEFTKDPWDDDWNFYTHGKVITRPSTWSSQSVYTYVDPDGKFRVGVSGAIIDPSDGTMKYTNKSSHYGQMFSGGGVVVSRSSGSYNRTTRIQKFDDNNNFDQSTYTVDLVNVGDNGKGSQYTLNNQDSGNYVSMEAAAYDSSTDTWLISTSESGKVWKSTDKFVSMSMVNNGASPFSITYLHGQNARSMCSNNNGKFFALVPHSSNTNLTQVHVSTDAGESFSSAGTPDPTGASLYFITYQNNKLFVGRNSSKLYSSTDDGVTWTDHSETMGTGKNLYDVQWDSVNNVYLLQGNNAIWTSADLSTWTEHTPDVGGDTLSIRNFLTSGGNWLAIGTSHGYISHDQGNTWRGITTPYSSMGDVAFRPADSKFYCFNDAGKFWKITDRASADFKTNASDRGNVGGAITRVEYDAGTDTFVAVGGSGKIYYSTNGGSSWSTVTLAEFNGDLNAVTFDGAKWYVAGNDGNLFHSTNLTNWTKADTGVTSHFEEMSSDANLLAVGGTGGAIFTSTDVQGTEYSDLYDATTEFMIPELVETNASTTTETKSRFQLLSVGMKNRHPSQQNTYENSYNYDIWRLYKIDDVDGVYEMLPNTADPYAAHSAEPAISIIHPIHNIVAFSGYGYLSAKRFDLENGYGDWLNSYISDTSYWRDNTGSSLKSTHWTPDGRYLISESSLRYGQITYAEFDINLGFPYNSSYVNCPNHSNIYSMKFHQDGAHFCVAGNNGIEIWYYDGNWDNVSLRKFTVPFTKLTDASGFAAHDVEWHPSGNYQIHVTGNFTYGYRVYRFNENPSFESDPTNNLYWGSVESIMNTSTLGQSNAPNSSSDKIFISPADDDIEMGTRHRSVMNRYSGYPPSFTSTHLCWSNGDKYQDLLHYGNTAGNTVIRRYEDHSDSTYMQMGGFLADGGAVWCYRESAGDHLTTGNDDWPFVVEVWDPLGRGPVSDSIEPVDMSLAGPSSVTNISHGLPSPQPNKFISGTNTAANVRIKNPTVSKRTFGDPKDVNSGSLIKNKIFVKVKH